MATSADAIRARSLSAQGGRRLKCMVGVDVHHARASRRRESSFPPECPRMSAITPTSRAGCTAEHILQPDTDEGRGFAAGD